VASADPLIDSSSAAARVTTASCPSTDSGTSTVTIASTLALYATKTGWPASTSRYRSMGAGVVLIRLLVRQSVAGFSYSEFVADPMAQFPDPEDRHALAADCRRCPALVESRERIAWGNGPTDAALVVVGEAPAAGETRPTGASRNRERGAQRPVSEGDPAVDPWQGGNLTGMAYTSRRSGRKVRKLVADLGFEGDAYYTNAVKCFPADPDDPTDNREPTPEERANCHPYLVREVETVDPLAVLATGKHATTSVLAAEGRDLDGFLDSVLDPVDCPTLGTTLVPLLHPSYEEVWRARLGYDDRAGYVAAVRETLADLP
jgi:DNA polymerase